MMRPIFDRVVMATDLSATWDQIVACGGELLELGCWRVILTYVVTPNLFGGSCGALRQRSNFARHHRKAPALLAGPGRFHGRIQCQDIGLKGDAVDAANDLGNPLRAVAELLHS